MAEVHDASGIPSVAPDTRAPDDYQRINATPESFGGAIGRGLERAGQGGVQAADNLFNIAAFQGRVNVDDQINQVMQGSSNLRHGEPGKTVPGPDGKPQPDPGYMGLVGRAALDRREDTVKSLDNLIDAGRKNLKSEQEQLEYDTQTRRMRSVWYDEIGRHADSQFRTWGAHVNTAGAKLALDHIAAHADNPDEVAHGTADLINFKVKDAQLRGGGDEQVREAIAEGNREALKARVESIGVTDPARALRMVEKNRTIAGTDYHTLANSFRARADTLAGHADADEVTGRSVQPAPPIANIPGGFVSAIKTSEGFAPRASWDYKQHSVGYGTKANDPNEVIDKPEADRRFAKEIDEAAKFVDTVNPNLDPGTRAALSSLTFNAGRDWANAGLGEAVRTGDINAARAKFLEYNKAGGETNSGLVARRLREATWFGAGDVPKGAPLVDKATAFERVLAATADNPARQSAALSRLNAIYSVYHADETERASALKLRVENTVREAVDTGEVKTPITEQEFIQADPVHGADAYRDYQQNIQFGADVNLLAGMSPEDKARLFERYAPQPGDQYAAAAKRRDALYKAEQHNQQQLHQDPADYALRHLPAVQTAWREFQGIAGNALAPIEAKQAAAQKFATTMNIEQQRVGVPAYERRLLPKTYIDDLNKTLMTPSAVGGPLEVAKRIDGEAKLWGNRWPDVYRQLSKEAEPVVRVIGSGVRPRAGQLLTELAAVPLNKIMDDNDTERRSQIKKDVLTHFKPLRDSLPGNVGGQRTFDDFQSQGEKLAAWYVAHDGKRSDDAAKLAFEELVGHKYNFRDTYRVPKPLPADVIARGAEVAKADLGKMDIMPANDTFGGLGADYLATVPVRAYQRDGKWVTSADESGLMLVYDDQAVRLKNGQPLILSWDQLATMKRQQDSAPQSARAAAIDASNAAGWGKPPTEAELAAIDAENAQRLSRADAKREADAAALGRSSERLAKLGGAEGQNKIEQVTTAREREDRLRFLDDYERNLRGSAHGRKKEFVEQELQKIVAERATLQAKK